MNSCTGLSDNSPTGRLIRKHQCHDRLSVNQPPSVGPTAGAVTTVSPYSANACARFSTGNESAKIDCSVGAVPPPPMPWMTREISIMLSEVDIAHITEAPVKIATQVM